VSIEIKRHFWIEEVILGRRREQKYVIIITNTLGMGDGHKDKLKCDKQGGR
jgi:hypothetical protein